MTDPSSLKHPPFFGTSMISLWTNVSSMPLEPISIVYLVVAYLVIVTAVMLSFTFVVETPFERRAGDRERVGTGSESIDEDSSVGT